ncbi:MAG: two-component regulator propeller domain-containing protein [Lysobacterales bacterium]|jgi:signal transduction histidine kinase/ligand-binding sensor domain-containing protein/CheY-like chemotaxis protein/AraC-like DNA-binding protein
MLAPRCILGVAALCLALGSLPGAGEVRAWQKDLRFDRISTDDGLPDEYVRAIAQDRFGFMWFGTGAGLARYDGYRFVQYRYDPTDPASLSSDQVLEVFVDRAGTVWVGTDRGLDQLDRSQGRFTHYVHDADDPGSLGGEVVKEIFEDSGGLLWIGHWFSGLSVLDPATGDFRHFHHDPEDPASLPAGAVFKIFEDGAGLIWVGTFNKSGQTDLAWLDRNSNTFRRFFTCEAADARCPAPESPGDRPGNTFALAIHESSEGILWIGGAGLFRYNRHTNSYRRYDLPEAAAGGEKLFVGGDIVEDSDGLLWIPDVYKGLFTFDPATGEFSRYQSDPTRADSLATNNLYTLFEDREGLVWVAAYNSGLSRFDPQSLRFGHYRYAADTPGGFLRPGVLKDIAEDETGYLWLAYEKELVRVDRRGEQAHVFALPDQDRAGACSDYINMIQPDRVGSLWLATALGLCRFDLQDLVFEPIPLADASPNARDRPAIFHVTVGPDGVLWLGTAAGVTRYDPVSGNTKFYGNDPSSPQALKGELFGVSRFDDESGVWIGSSSALMRLDTATGEITLYSHDPANPRSISPGFVTALVEQDGLWVGTASGLEQFDRASGSFRHVTDGNGELLGLIEDIVPDPDGKLWLAGNFGLREFDPRTGQLRSFGVLDGVAARHMGWGISLRTGELAFISSEGINLFDPQKLPVRPVTPSVAITDFLLLNQPVQPGDDPRSSPLTEQIDTVELISLGYDDYLFGFEFAALSFRKPSALRFAFKLEGFDDSWIETGADRRVATYTNVPPGNYRFRVKARLGDGEWRESPRVLTLSMAPPPWRTWWAYTTYAIAFLLSLTAFIRLRTLGLTRRTQTLEAAVEERTREIRAHESQIEQLAGELETQLELRERYISNISHEFRTPLTLILGPVKRMLEGSTDPEEHARLDMIRRNGARLLRLVDQLLGIAKLSAEPARVVSPQPVSEVAAALVESFRPLAEERRLDLSCDCDKDVWARCAPDALEHILLNLLSNAIKHTPPGERIDVSVFAASEGEVAVKVANSGAVIPADQQQAVFERFHRVPGVAEARPGAGLGLALARDLAVANGGELSLESDESQGTEFTVRLPHALPSGKESKDRDAGKVSEAVRLEIDSIQPARFDDERQRDDVFAQKPLILVIEDNAEMLDYLTGLLGVTYACSTARTGPEGLEKALEQVPDLILCDLMLPGMDGVQLSHAVKQDERTSHVPIIILTARRDTTSRKESWKEKVDAFLTKPFDDEELLLRIANLLELREILKERFSGHFFSHNGSHAGLGSKDREFMDRLESVLEKHHADPDFGLQQMATEMYVSPRQLQRKLRALTGLAPSGLLRSYRLRRARDLLLDGTQIGVASDAVGFSSSAYFTSCFKAQFSTTPSEFQRQGVPRGAVQVH